MHATNNIVLLPYSRERGPHAFYFPGTSGNNILSVYMYLLGICHKLQTLCVAILPSMIQEVADGRPEQETLLPSIQSRILLTNADLWRLDRHGIHSQPHSTSFGVIYREAHSLGLVHAQTVGTGLSFPTPH